MKKITHTVLCFLLFVLISLSGCMFSNDKKDAIKNIDNPNIDKAGPEVRILYYFNNWYDGVPKESGDSEIIEQLQKNLRENGFNVKLIPYYDYSIALARQKYTEAIKEMSASGSIDAFHIPSKYLEQKEPDSKLLEELETMNLNDIFRKNAPILNKKLEQLGVLKSSDKISFIPMNVTSRAESGRNVVTMREDVAKQFNIENIRTLSEYEQILQMIKSKTQYIPGCIHIYKYYDVMLEELGYYSIDTALGGDLGGRLFAYKNNDEGLLNLLPIEQIPDISAQFSRLYNLHQKDLLKFSGGYPDLTNVASFIRREGDVMPASFDSENSSTFILNPDKPKKKVFALNYDRINILKDSNKAEEIIRLLDWINSKAENMRLVRYGIKGKDYSIENNSIKALLEGKMPVNHEAVVRTYNYRYRFQFLLNSSENLILAGDSEIFDIEHKSAGKANYTLLPLEKLIMDNPGKDIDKIINEVTNEYKQRGQDIVKLINTRTSSIYKLLEYIPYNINGFDILMKNPNTDEVKIIQEYYSEIIKRIGQ